MTLNKALKNKRPESEYDIYLQLKFVYEYSYMFKVEYDFKFLHFMDNVDAMPNDDKLTLAIEYQNALRTLLGMIPFKAGLSGILIIMKGYVRTKTSIQAVMMKVRMNTALMNMNKSFIIKNQ